MCDFFLDLACDFFLDSVCGSYLDLVTYFYLYLAYDFYLDLVFCFCLYFQSGFLLDLQNDSFLPCALFQDSGNGFFQHFPRDLVLYSENENDSSNVLLTHGFF